MSIVSYGSNPKACFTWNTANLNYVVISYSSIGNATVSSANLTSGTYTSPDLSLNSSYTFTMTPYNLLGITGTPKIFTMDTTAPTTYAAAVGGGATSTSSAVKLQWYGSYSYVAISQSVNGGSYVDLSAVVVSTPYTVSDVSGNTALSYKITPYYSGVAGTATSVITVNTNVQAPRDVSAVYVDSSGALISFTAPKNTYSSSAVYTVRRTDPSGNTADVSGTTSPLWIQNLSAGIVYTVVAKTTLDGSASLVSTSSAVSFTTNIIKASDISAVPIYTSATTTSIFSSFTLTVTGVTGTYSYANGTYIINTSSSWDNNIFVGYKMFNNLDGQNGWFSGQNTYNATTGVYTGSTSTVSSGNTIYGEYNQIKFPYKLKLNSYITTNSSGVNSITSIKDFAVVASNDGTTWITIDTNIRTNIVDVFTVSTTTGYYYYRLIAKTGTPLCGFNATGLRMFSLIGVIVV